MVARILAFLSEKPMSTIVALVGSLRAKSYNRALLNAAIELLPSGHRIEIAEIGELPLFNEDLEANPPASVSKLKQQIAAADAVLFVTPEYNYSVPGVLKNAIDWASRPYGKNSFEGKPAAIMGASVGNLGSARAQYHLRQIAVFLDLKLLNKPEVMVPNASKSFDGEGKLVSEDSRKNVQKLLESLIAWAEKLRG